MSLAEDYIHLVNRGNNIGILLKALRVYEKAEWDVPDEHEACTRIYRDLQSRVRAERVHFERRAGVQKEVHSSGVKITFPLLWEQFYPRMDIHHSYIGAHLTGLEGVARKHEYGNCSAGYLFREEGEKVLLEADSSEVAQAFITAFVGTRKDGDFSK